MENNLTEVDEDCFENVLHRHLFCLQQSLLAAHSRCTQEATNRRPGSLLSVETNSSVVELGSRPAADDAREMVRPIILADVGHGYSDKPQRQVKIHRSSGVTDLDTGTGSVVLAEQETNIDRERVLSKEPAMPSTPTSPPPSMPPSPVTSGGSILSPTFSDSEQTGGRGSRSKKPALKRSTQNFSSRSRSTVFTAKDSERLTIHPAWVLGPDWELDSKMKAFLSDDLASFKKQNPTFRTSVGGGTSRLSNRLMVHEASILESPAEVCINRFVVDPNTPFRTAWDICGVLLLLYDVVFIPMQFFDPDPNVFTQSVQWFSVVYWLLDVGASFCVGFPKDGIVEMRLSQIARRYLTTWFIFDLFVVGLDVVMVIMDGNDERQHGLARLSKSFRAFRVLRTLRLLRVLLRLPRILEKLQENVQTEGLMEIMGVFKLLGCIVLTCHVIACFWYGQVGLLQTTSDNWLQFVHVDSKAYAYTTALHWSLTQFTPASMEVTPRNTQERIFTVLVILFAMVAFSSFISSISASTQRLVSLSGDHSRQMQVLQRYFRNNNISLRLCVRVRRHLDYVMLNQNQHIKEKEVFLLGMLTDQLREELRYEVFGETLNVHPFFSRYDAEHHLGLKRVCDKSVEQVELPRGEVLFRNGDEAVCMYFAWEGDLIYHQQYTGLKYNVAHGEWLAEAALWTTWVHRGQASCLQDGSVVAIIVSAFLQSMASFAAPSHYAHLFVAQFDRCSPELWSDLPATDFKIAEAVAMAWAEIDPGDGDLGSDRASACSAEFVAPHMPVVQQ